MGLGPLLFAEPGALFALAARVVVLIASGGDSHCHHFATTHSHAIFAHDGIDTCQVLFDVRCHDSFTN
jgi:hypothetical protein